MAKNKDYYGVEIRHSGDNPVMQAGELGAHAVKAFVPFWMRGTRKAIDRGDSALSMAAPLVGIMPATSEFTKTPAQKLASELVHSRMPNDAMTAEAFEKRKIKNKIEMQLRNGDPEAMQALIDARKEGKLTPYDIRDIQRDRRFSVFQNTFKRLSLEEAMKVYELATPDEKKSVRPLLAKKADTLKRMDPEKRMEVAKALRSMLSGVA